MRLVSRFPHSFRRQTKMLFHLCFQLSNSGTHPSACQLPNEVAFLAFSSSGSSTSGTGFRLRLEPVGFYPEPVFTGFHISDSQGVVSHPFEGENYGNSERVTFVFQLNGPNTMELTRLETDEGYDSVSVFTIFPFQDNAEPALDGKLVIIWELYFSLK